MRLEQVADLGEQYLLLRRGGRRGLLRFHHEAEELHDEKVEHERDDDEVHDLAEEEPVGDFLRADHDLPAEVALLAGRQYPHGRHEDVLDQGIDDLGERGADDHAHSEVDDVPLQGEVLEFIEDRERAARWVDRTNRFQRIHTCLLGLSKWRSAPGALIVGFHLGFFKNIFRGVPMRFGTHSAGAAAQAALAGKVSSAEEGAMEGVLVSAKKAGSTITITVVSDAKGQYSFPAAKLEPGRYAIGIRAVGYDLEGPGAADVAAGKTAALDLKLKKTADLAAQLSNGEWMTSAPGTDQQKGLLLNCVGCHSLERVMRSPHDADAFTKTVLPRMQAYVNQSIPQHPQLRKAERLMEERGDQRVQVYRSTAEYLATINRGPAQKWSYELKTHARPSGRATRVVYTEYDLPRETISPHDVIVDSEGIAWYSSFGEQNLGRLDPKTGKVIEYPIDVHKPGFPTGLLGLRSDKAGSLWLGNMYQATIVKFDPRTTKFTTWKLPSEQNIDAAQVNMVR